MSRSLLAAALALYSGSAAAYLAAFARPALTRAVRGAYALAAAGFAVQTAAIGVGCAETYGRHLLTAAGAAGLVGWFAAGAFLVAQRALRKAAAGAFALPLVFLASLPAAAAPVAGLDAGSALAAIPAVRLHVLTAAGGIALLGLASAVAVLYLLQQRELKAKRFGPLLSRLPPLQVLERTSSALLALGFGVFTVAVASGSIVARSAWCQLWEWDGQQVASVLAWALFGALVLARFAGNRGRRQAVMTIANFAFVVSLLAGLRGVGATRHDALDTALASSCEVRV
jgi:ABC-type uncharacterized transport system permease subunit